MNNFVGFPHHQEFINNVGKTYSITLDQMKGVKEKSLKAKIVTKLYGEKLTHEEVFEIASNRYKSLTYQRKGNEVQIKVNQEIPKVIPSSSEDLNVDLGSWIQNAKVLVQVVELVKILSQKEKLIKAIKGPQRSKKIIFKVPRESNENLPVVLHSKVRTKENNPLFFVSMLLNGLYLHNCMYSGASSNVIIKKVMNQLDLKITRPYKNVCAMDSTEVEVHGIILGLQLKLAAYPKITFQMDILVIDVPDAWGMLLSRKWGVTLGGSIQMDLSYATIRFSKNAFVKLHREK